MDYATVKTVHLSAVALSAAGFLARGAGAFAGAGWVRSRAARTLPHVVDTVLLGSALAMLAMLHANPFALPWLTAKIVGLLLYIGLGFAALKPRLPLPARVAAWVAALAVFAWIVSVALTKRPAGFLG